jgi:hypothetical protein
MGEPNLRASKEFVMLSVTELFKILIISLEPLLDNDMKEFPVVFDLII